MSEYKRVMEFGLATAQEAWTEGEAYGYYIAIEALRSKGMENKTMSGKEFAAFLEKNQKEFMLYGPYTRD